jgi:hypothetical protein
MSRLAQHVGDERVLKLIRRYLEAGLMREGVIAARGMARRKAGRSRPCDRTSCSRMGIANWGNAGRRFVQQADPR